MKVRIRTAAAMAALALPLALGACSSGGDTASPTTSASSAAVVSDGSDPYNAPAGAEVDKDVLLEQTQQAMLAKKTYAMNMTMAMSGQNIAIKSVGDMSDPNTLKVKLTMQMPGSSQGIQMLVIGKDMYMQMPGQAGGKYVQMPMEQLAQTGGQDLEKMLNPGEILKVSKDSVQKATFVGEEDVSGTKLKHFSLVLDPAKANAAAGMTPTAMPSAALAPVPYDMWVDGEKLMRKVEMTYQGTKMTVLVDKYGEPVDIVKPPTASVTTMPGLGDVSGATAKPTAG